MKNKNRQRGSYASSVSKLDWDSEDLSDDPLTINGQLYFKNPRHWYEEGNIAFLAQSTAFRLHGSVLSRRSTVMAKLISLPRPAPAFSFSDSKNGETIIGGVPFVVLRDKAEDFEHVLDFIYPNTLPAAQTEHLGVHDLMGMIRLAGKYCIQDLLEWAISKLGREFLLLPSHRSVAKVLKDEERYSDPMFCVQVIQFSRQCSLPQFLPLAFYALATKDWSVRPGEVTCLRQLSREDQGRVHEGRTALTKEVLKKALVMPENHAAPAKCSSWSCSEISPAIWSNGRERWQNLMLYPIEELENRLTLKHASLCKDCNTKVKTRTQEFRDGLVRELTSFFTLD
ncbi:hypothetical protein FRC01_012589 [Tulasnella sp. 417]|nr:hypothetical protein FRC01_012589 [Tulasnella sp. 417]